MRQSLEEILMAFFMEHESESFLFKKLVSISDLLLQRTLRF